MGTLLAGQPERTAEEVSRSIEVCGRCKGRGEVDQTNRDVGGGNNGADHFYTVKVPCKDCEGSGRVFRIVIQKPWSKEKK